MDGGQYAQSDHFGCDLGIFPRKINTQVGISKWTACGLMVRAVDSSSG